MYYTIQNNSILTANNAEILTKYYGEANELPEDYEEGKYIAVEGELALNENFEQEQAQKERERINMLSLTAADVERAIYKAKGMDFEDIIELVKDNPQIDLKALKIEFKANNFYRGNPYINQIGGLLGYTSDDLDYLFENKELPPVAEQETDSENLSDDNK